MPLRKGVQSTNRDWTLHHGSHLSSPVRSWWPRGGELTTELFLRMGDFVSQDCVVITTGIAAHLGERLVGGLVFYNFTPTSVNTNNSSVSDVSCLGQIKAEGSHKQPLRKGKTLPIDKLGKSREDAMVHCSSHGLRLIAEVWSLWSCLMSDPEAERPPCVIYLGKLTSKNSVPVESLGRCSVVNAHSHGCFVQKEKSQLH